MIRRMAKIRYQYYLLWVLGLLIFGGAALPVSAQTGEETPWSPPLNLSNSGSALDPALVVDSTGQAHTFWRDPFRGFMYASGDGRSWSEPVIARVPFGVGFDDGVYVGYTPTLVAGPEDIVHAFWIDDDNILFYSRVNVATITTLEGWTAPQVVARAAVAFEARVGEDGRLHLAYVRNRGDETTSAGVYYRQAADGLIWGETITPLYQSDYFRAIPAEQAHLQLEVGPSGQVYAAWDDPFLEAVFLAQSADGGETWSDSETIDQRQPEDTATATGPSQIAVLATDRTVHLVWRAQHGQEDCRQFHQRSPDGGDTWQDVEALPAEGIECPESHRLLAGAEDGLIYLLTQLRGEFYLRAWDGERWSAGEEQTYLSGFIHPQVFREVMLGCLHYAVLDDNRLLVLGCGSGVTEDVWALQRPLGDADDWAPLFPSPLGWSSPRTVADSGALFTEPHLLTDSENRTHALWIGASSDASGADDQQEREVENTLYYLRQEDGEWSRRVPVRDIGAADQLSAVIVNNQIFAVIRDSQATTLSISRVNLDDAVFPGDWSDFQEVFSLSSSFLSAPSLYVAQSGNEQTIYLAFALPLNEERGIYLLKSTDNGLTWSEPSKTFDAAEATWLMVDSPQLTQAADGSLHLTWIRYSPVGDNEPLALYYARSEDGGAAWSAPQMVAEGPVHWRRLISVDETTLVRVWQEKEAQFATATVWFDVSSDNGVSWENPSSLASNALVTGPLQLLKDQAERLHLVEMKLQANINPFAQKDLDLTTWIWEGTSWSLDEQLTISQADPSQDTLEFAATINGSGNFRIIYPELTVPDDNGLFVETQTEVHTIFRPLQLPQTAENEENVVDDAEEVVSSAEQNDVASEVAQSTDESEEVPDQEQPSLDEASTNDFPLENETNNTLQIGPIDTSTGIGKLLLTVAPVLLLISIVFIVTLRFYRRA